MKTDTPRTDTQKWINRYPEYHEKATRYVSADFARELERENTRLRDQFVRLESAVARILADATEEQYAAHRKAIDEAGVYSPNVIISHAPQSPVNSNP